MDEKTSRPPRLRQGISKERMLIFMKKTRLLPLLILVLVCLCISASAASAESGISGQAYIASISDQNGSVTTLTDGSTTTTWTQSSTGYGPDLTINLYSATVGEIWVRNGHCYSQNYYNHYDRPEVIKVTLWYSANYYTTNSVTYRYRMSDAYRPASYSASWNNGYQRMLLPEQLHGVTSIELTIESTTQGYGRTGATITDIVVSSGSHATATPRTYATATPKPYVQYITPSPTPYTQYVTPTPTRYVEYITPTPTRNVQYVTPTPTRAVVLLTPEPTRTPQVEVIRPATTTPPLVELITPEPQVTPDIPTFLSEGVPAPLLRSIATRSGPSAGYDEPGSFFGAGTYVNVISKSWDEINSMWWMQVEFNYRGIWMRAYTPANRIDIDPDRVPTENTVGETCKVTLSHRVYAGPGYEYDKFMVSLVYEGARVVVYAYEERDGVLWAQIHYREAVSNQNRRAWVPAEILTPYMP